MFDQKCGCGRPVKYATPGKEDEGSCNKHGRCSTYEELGEAVMESTRCLRAYQKAMNEIDDYFEYSMESKKDQKKVHQILSNLTDTIKSVIH